MLALHDMLKQQLELTKSFLSSQQALYQSMSNTLDHKYRYTTLQDTKKVCNYSPNKTKSHIKDANVLYHWKVY